MKGPFSDIVMENYHKARDIVAKEVSEKYGLVETFRDDNLLSLKGRYASFHFRNNVREGIELCVTEHGKNRHIWIIHYLM